MFPIILIIITLVLLALIVTLILMRKRMKHHPTDYYGMFIMGIIWMAFGIIALFSSETSMGFFLIIGVAFAGIGLANRKHWKKNRRSWKDLSPAEQRVNLWVMSILGLLVLAGLIVFIAMS